MLPSIFDTQLLPYPPDCTEADLLSGFDYEVPWRAVIDHIRLDDHEWALFVWEEENRLCDLYSDWVVPAHGPRISYPAIPLGYETTARFSPEGWTFLPFGIIGFIMAGLTYESTVAYAHILTLQHVHRSDAFSGFIFTTNVLGQPAIHATPAEFPHASA